MKTESTHRDFDFLYVLEPHGWSTCLIYVNNDIYELGPTHVFCNPIEELLNAVCQILSGSSSARFEWQYEPGKYEWELLVVPDQNHLIRVNVRGCVRHQFETKPTVEDLGFEVKIRLFCICVLSQMRKIRDQLSERSFRENGRSGQFPYAAFEQFEREFDARFV